MILHIICGPILASFSILAFLLTLSGSFTSLYLLNISLVFWQLMLVDTYFYRFFFGLYGPPLHFLGITSYKESISLVLFLLFGSLINLAYSQYSAFGLGIFMASIFF